MRGQSSLHRAWLLNGRCNFPRAPTWLSANREQLEGEGGRPKRKAVLEICFVCF